MVKWENQQPGIKNAIGDLLYSAKSDSAKFAAEVCNSSGRRRAARQTAEALKDFLMAHHHRRTSSSALGCVSMVLQG